MFIKDWKKEIFTIPNLLSCLRLLLIPVYMVIYLRAQTQREYIIAGLILAVSCLTDLADGYIARRFHMITTLGKFLDPLADKITQFTLILSLSIRYNVLWSILSLFVVKEIFQLIAGALAVRHGYILKGALFSGKICTTILFLSLVALVALPQITESAVNLIAIVDGVFLTLAFADYVFTYLWKKSRFQSLDENPQC